MKRLTAFSKFILFLTSYIPLGIICLIIDFDGSSFPYFKNGYYTVSLLIIIILLIILLIFLGRHFIRRPTGWEKMRVISAENMNNQILAYIFTYILPFLRFPVGRQIVIGIFMLILVGILYIKSDMIGINPLLSVFGYNIVKVKWNKGDTEKIEEATLISKLDSHVIKKSLFIDVLQIHNEIHLLRGKK